MSIDSPGPTASEAGRDIDASLASDQIPEGQRASEPVSPPEPATMRLIREITSGSVAITILAVLVALIVGALLIAVTNQQGYLSAIANSYESLFKGGVYDYTQSSFLEGIKPFLSSLGFATPLIAAGLGIGIGFRAGIFNIGGQGQMLAGGAMGGWLGYQLHLPLGPHLLIAIVAGIACGAAFAALAGLLKAYTGAHEVITTIMLNYVAYYLLSQLLQGPLKAPGQPEPVTRPELTSGTLPNLFGAQYPVNLGFVIVIALTIFAWWLMSRSSMGFQFRAVGENPKAARVAGISVNRMVIVVMLVSGALVGFAGIYETLGATPTGFTNAFDSGIGFNAITVALLGRNKPWGIFWSGILFGIFQAGGYAMQAADGLDINIVLVLQSIIVLFIAAPPLVRAIFHLPEPGRRRVTSRQRPAKETVSP